MFGAHLVVSAGVTRIAADGGDRLVWTGDGPPLSARAVVLACGGFEWNDDMVRAFIGREIFPLSPPHNEGDGHRMAMEAGAALANMTSFWGQPALVDPDVDF